MFRSPVLAAQTFAGSPLVRGAAGRRLDQILCAGADTPAWFCLVADRRVAVTSGPPGGGAGGSSTAVHWLDRAGLAASGLAYPGTGDELTLEGGPGEAPVAAPVYLLGEDVPASALRLAVDVSAAPPAWAQQQQQQRGVRLQVRGQGWRWLCPSGTQAGTAAAVVLLCLSAAPRWPRASRPPRLPPHQLSSTAAPAFVDCRPHP